MAYLVLQVLSWVAEEERPKIKTRQAEGIAVAKAQGKHLGRPKNNYYKLSLSRLINNGKQEKLQRLKQ